MSWWSANLVLFHSVIPWHMAKAPGPSHCFCGKEFVGDSLTSVLALCSESLASAAPQPFYFAKHFVVRTTVLPLQASHTSEQSNS